MCVRAQVFKINQEIKESTSPQEKFCFLRLLFSPGAWRRIMSLDFIPFPTALLQVVLLAPEAKNPARDVPRALFASLLGVTLICATASVALSGAEAAPDLDADSAFAEVFRRRGLTAAYKVHTAL